MLSTLEVHSLGSAMINRVVLFNFYSRIWSSYYIGRCCGGGGGGERWMLERKWWRESDI